MEQFIVIALATSTDTNFEECRIIAQGTQFDATHKQVYGPESKEDCEQWAIENCNEEPDGTKTGNNIVVALTASLPAKYEQCMLLNESDVIIATHSKVFGPEIEDECQKWVNENCGKGTNLPIVDPSNGKNWVKSLILEGWTSYVLIALGLFLMIFLITVSARYYVTYEAQRLTKEFKLDNKPVECKIAPPEKQSFINAQRQEIVSYAIGHRDTAIAFSGYFYATLMIVSFFGLIAAISLAVITKSGINTASPHLIAVFLISTGIVILYQGFLGVFQQKSNMDSNAKLSVSYARLLNQIDTYCTTGKVNVRDPNSAFLDALSKSDTKVTPTSTPSGTPTLGESTTLKPEGNVKVSPFYVSLEPDEFINYVDWQMGVYKGFSVSIDETKIAIIDAKKMMVF
ncbi:MAG: hypothetical protein M3Q99_16535 [Acidobacteriota bacterium]|nr:hypothetical protein [Acidobacteriota bacterium]